LFQKIFLPIFWLIFSLFPIASYLSIKGIMRIKLSLKQLKTVIEKTGEVKLPVTVYLEGIEKEEFAELIKLIKANQKD
jgi:hypothetical protein